MKNKVWFTIAGVVFGLGVSGLINQNYFTKYANGLEYSYDKKYESRYYQDSNNRLRGEIDKLEREKSNIELENWKLQNEAVRLNMSVNHVQSEKANLQSKNDQLRAEYWRIESERKQIENQYKVANALKRDFELEIDKLNNRRYFPMPNGTVQYGRHSTR